MFSILLGLIFNLNSLIAIAVMAGIAALIYVTLGPVRLMKIAADVRTWLVIFAVLAVMAFAHSEKRNDELEAKIDAAAQQQTADEDAQDSLERRATQRETRRRQDDRIRDAIGQAPPGQRHDAALDQIAAEQAARTEPLSTPASPTSGAQDEVLDQRAAAQAAPDPGPVDVPAADRVRKQPDVVVVP
jgi:hypothetical protein